MTNTKKFALSLLVLSPLVSSAMDIGLSLGLRGSFDIYGGEPLDFAEYTNALPGTATTENVLLNGSKISLNKDYGAAGSLSVGAVISNMFIAEVEGGFATSFMQTGTDSSTVITGGKLVGTATQPELNSSVVTKDKDVVKFNLPYVVAGAYFTMEIPDTGIVPYIGGGAGVVFANLSFDENAVTGKVKEVKGDGSAVGSAAQDLKEVLKEQGQFKYELNGVYHASVGVGYKISDEMEISAGYRIMGGIAEGIEYKRDGTDESIITAKLLKHSVLVTLRYNIDFSDHSSSKMKHKG